MSGPPFPRADARDAARCPTHFDTGSASLRVWGACVAGELLLVAVAAEGVMAPRSASQNASTARTKRRAKLVELARQLARTGRHADHTTIVRELETSEGFEEARVRFEDRAFRAQLDKLCAMARAVDSAAARESNELRQR